MRADSASAITSAAAAVRAWEVVPETKDPPRNAAWVMGEPPNCGRLTVVTATWSEARSKTVGNGCHSCGSTPASQLPSMLTTLSWAGSRTSYPTSPCWPGASPVPRLAREAAVVEGKAASSHTGTAPWPCWIMPRRKGVCAVFCLSRPRPSPSARTTHTRLACGRPSAFSKPGTPILAAALPSTSATERRPYAGAAGRPPTAGPGSVVRTAETGNAGPEEWLSWSCISALVPAAEPAGKNAHAGTRVGGRRRMPHRRGRPGVHRTQGTGKKLGVLDSLQAVGLGADPQDDVLLGNGAAVAVVGLTLRIAAARRTHVQALATGPGDGQGDLADRVRRLVVLRLGVHVAQHHRPDLRHRNGLRGNLRHDLFARLVELLVIHMGDHQHVLGEDQDGDVPADLGPVEMRLKVDQVCQAVPAVQGVIHHVGHQQRVE